ncbi:D-sedoheptulose 7-phosphate isomerase [Azospirillum brasilense]|uniref:Phosphoheptose isomerase n=1 Tax=Azospirillum brasilense TaxID=192 RepID=A0A560BWP5_AZOBR|nr:D-sedoheptulose 7-phosphate isomerase [Azospirillum brasilense]MBK3734744.1 D-sedoheptulose 7-phosphate isomerase [Azospirillum brasilense]TWA77037.1 D-sedoheptulose 7-phosphate isomerase [Azospirillum brasilense]
MTNPADRVRDAFLETSRNFVAFAEQADAIAAAATVMIDGLRAGGKVLFCGNGGSAADSQHLAAELTGRYLRDRPPLAAVALTVDTSALTAIANDYSYDEVFARQVRGLGRAGDVLVGISTSGNSRNVVAALEAARALGMRTVGLTGAGGGRMKELCDVCLCVPSSDTPRIQEMHIAAGHMLCELVENAFV